MAMRAISLLQRISLDMAVGPRKCTPCVVPMQVCMCRTKHLRSLFSLLTVLCYVYCISFLPRLMGRQGTMY